MEKRCSGCSAVYWARWRNEPVSFCPACRASAVLCTTCAETIAPPHDAAQLELFPLLVWRTPARVDTPTVEERYVSLRAKATQAERRRYPYC